MNVNVSFMSPSASVKKKKLSDILFPSKYPLVDSEGNSELTMYDPERNKREQVK